METVALPLDRLAVGRPIPVDVWSSGGQLLLRRGQCLVSEQERERLRAHQAAVGALEALAWQRAHERQMHQMLRAGVPVAEVARAPMPGEIEERDYLEERQLNGGWLDLQEVLRGLLHHAGLGLESARRLAGIQSKALDLLHADADDSLFCLLQALADDRLGYCASHALLCAVVSELTADKLGLAAPARATLFGAALTMNIGMALEQDVMARQSTPLSQPQRELVRQHPALGATLLPALGLRDPALLDIVRWHHQPEAAAAHAGNLVSRRILCIADMFVAKMAARRTRAPLSPLQAARSIYLGAADAVAPISAAMAAAVGFYPPGSHVRLVSGEVAVVIQRGARANTPWVLPVQDRHGMPRTDFRALDTAEPAHAVAAPISLRKPRITLDPQRVRRERARLRGADRA